MRQTSMRRMRLMTNDIADMKAEVAAREVGRRSRSREKDPIMELIEEQNRRTWMLLNDDVRPLPFWWRSVVDGDGPLGPE